MGSPTSIRDNRPSRGSPADFLRASITPESALSFVSAYFTVHAYDALRDELHAASGLRFLFGEPSFISQVDNGKAESRRFSLSEAGLSLANALPQRRLARECADWIRSKVEIRSVVRSGFLHGKLFHINNGHSAHAVLGSSNFTVPGLGLHTDASRNNVELNIIVASDSDRADLLAWFDELWNDRHLVADVKDEVLRHLERLYGNQPPQFIYYLTLFHVFRSFLDENRDAELQLDKTTLYDSEIWKRLFGFQRDGVRGAIRRLLEQIVPPAFAIGTFPLEHLHPLMRDMVIYSARCWQVDPALTAAAALATVAAAIGKGAVAVDAVVGRTTPANLYFMVGAPRSYGKGSAQELAAPMMEADQSATEGREKGGDGELDRSLWTGNFTSAGLLPLLIANKHQIFTFSVEAGDAVRIALGKFDRDGRGDLDLLLAGYSVEWYATTRAGSGTQRVRPCITAFWAVQPFILREMSTNKEALERGMLARFLPVVIEPDSIPQDDGKREAIPPGLVKQWGALNRELLLLRDRSEPLVVRVDPEAMEEFLAFHNETVDLRNGSCRDIQGELGRWRENAIRLGLGQAVVDAISYKTEPVLRIEHAKRGIALMRFFGRQQLLLLQSGRVAARTSRADKLAAALRMRGGKASLGDLKDSHNLPDAEVRELCSAMPKRFQIVHLNPGRVGRPAFEVRLIA